MMKRIFLFLLAVAVTAVAGADTRWKMRPDGWIVWTGEQLTPHEDHIEMSGKRVSVVFRYGVQRDGSVKVNKGMVWPMLRTIPNNTHGSLMQRVEWDMLDHLVLNNRRASVDKVERIGLKGKLLIESRLPQNARLVRAYFPSTEQPAVIEIMSIKNDGDQPLKVSMPYNNQISLTDPAKGVCGAYAVRTMVYNPQTVTLAPGEGVTFHGAIYATVEGTPALMLDCSAELEQRENLVEELQRNLQLVTPDEVINRMFAFSKIRACESIYETAGGPMHGPGGESYYAAIWANDQAEYVNPYFPFVGYAYGNASALNSYLMFARYMNDEMKPIPSSIIAEGQGTWNGAGDRGDAAMIAYGAARYVLARGDKGEATQLWPLIKWCLDYCKHQLNADGVARSDSDELEGRFPAGEANLCTSSLYYDALLSASYLAPLMGEPQLAKTFAREAKTLRANINRYFAGPVEGFNTYAYYKGNDILRSWICIPLVMGIDEKATATLDALFSPRLWTENGLLTQAGTETFWDRTTLYALRGAFYVGATERALDFLHRYSETRLLGEHVPYAIEAWPEGSQRHLSAESGLYGRIITEGLFGLRPTGFRSFDITPHLPEAWPEMELRYIRAFGSDFDIKVQRIKGSKLRLTVSQPGSQQTYTLANGQTKRVTLK